MVSIHSQHLTFKSTTINSPFMVVVVISKKTVSLATGRNKVKRQLRELFKDSPTHGAVYVKKGVGDVTYVELKAETEEILSKLIKG